MDNLYDTHFHLDLQKSRSDTLSEIERNKIYTVAVTNLPPLYEKLKKEVDSKFVRIALGFHPELIGQYQKYIPDMWRLLPNVKYIGEVGVDLKTGKDSKSQQISFFEELINRCNIFGNKVLSVHSRMAAPEVVSVIGEKFSGKIILHWYSGSNQTVSKAIENGYYFSVNSAMLNSNSGRKVIENIPNSRILIETDSPFISVDGLVNSQLTHIQKIITQLSILKKTEHNELQDMLWNNFLSVISIY